MEVKATSAIRSLFGDDDLSPYVDSSLKMILQGKPTIDGVKNLAGCHFYNTDHGRIGTFAMWIKGIPFSIYIGMEKEIDEMRKDFYRIAEEAGVQAVKTPKDKAKERKRLRKKGK